MRLIVGITGASGVVYGVRLLQVLRELGVETHLVVSKAAEKLIKYEVELSLDAVKSLASKCYAPDDLMAPITSGSYVVEGAVVAPCSMKTLAGIACGYSDNLLLRAVEVSLKERRRVVIVVREMPFSLIHLENMVRVARAGGTLMAASPAFYHKPKSLSDAVDHVVGKVLDLFHIEHSLYRRWEGGT
ncbi:MAG: UbiX family flavin prenyltransferase [Candidatus Bathyarchaeia archaeon]